MCTAFALHSGSTQPGRATTSNINYQATCLLLTILGLFLLSCFAALNSPSSHSVVLIATYWPDMHFTVCSVADVCMSPCECRSLWKQSKNLCVCGNDVM